MSKKRFIYKLLLTAFTVAKPGSRIAVSLPVINTCRNIGNTLPAS